MNIFNKDRLDESIPNNDINRSSVWSRVFAGEENHVYSDVIIKGFVWVVMFIISFVALFIVFNDNFMKPKEIVVINNKDKTDYYSTDTNTSSNNQDFSFNNYSDNSNKQVVDNKDAGLISDGNNSTNTTAALKGVMHDNVADSPGNNIVSKNNTSVSKKFSNPNINSLISNSIKENQTSTQSSNNTNVLSSSKINSVLKKDVAVSSITKTDYGKAWLVVIYSGNKENLVKQKWPEFNKRYSKLFINKKPYFMKIDIPNKGVYYRLGLGDLNTNKALPYFNSAKEASKYCKYLVNNKVSCFVIEAQKNVLSDLLFNQ